MGFLYWGGVKMKECQKVLNRIEALVERLPYKTIRLEIEMTDETFTLEKTKRNPIGFRAEEL